MIISQLAGGLGNQMFQYALGRKLAIKNNDILKLDTSNYTNKDLSRTYNLGVFNIKAEIASLEEIRRLKLPFGFLSRLWRAFKFHGLRIFNIGFNPQILNKTGDIYLTGFWQSEKYFAGIASVIRTDFTPKEPLSLVAKLIEKKIRSSKLPVSLHVRRGDYLQGDYWGTCSIEYYTQAIKTIQKKVSLPLTLFTFSDDIEWVKENMALGIETISVSQLGLEAWEELYLMSLCHHHIIANSSFSWWGAWLNPRPDKIVIAPRVWFRGKPKVYKDIVPESWIKI